MEINRMENKLERIKSFINQNKKEGILQLKRMENTLKFKCQKCGKCCNSNLPIVLIKREKSDKLFKDSKKIIGVSLLKKGKPCSKYKDKCSIYKNRPVSCKAYPFYYNPSNKMFYFDESCPGIGKGRKIKKRHLYRIKKYRKKFWRELRLSKKELEEACKIFFEANKNL